MSIEVDNRAWREVYEEYCKDEISSEELNLQNVFTPYELCEDMIHRLQVYCPIFKDLKFGVFNLEFADILMYDYGVSGEQITFITDCKSKSLFAESERYSGVNIEVINYMDLLNKRGLNKEKNMKFDVIIMNPPYQKVIGDVTKPIWDKFVTKSLDLIKDDGFLCAIHPSGWREPSGQFKTCQNAIKERHVCYLETNDRESGVKMFGVQTAYDWYILKNSSSIGFTNIKSKNNEIVNVDLKRMEFIPNSMLNEIYKLIAKPSETRVNVLHSFSDYFVHPGGDKSKPWMSKTKSEEFKYPCIYSILKDGTKSLYFSKTKEKGHFGIPKVIFSNGTSLPFVDHKGDYGLTQFAYAVIDSPSVLQLISKAMLTTKFLDIMNACQLIGKHRYSSKALSLFRCDFWKEFVDENGNEI